MDEKKAREILKDIIRTDGGLADGGLADLSWYLDWQVGDEEATLDGPFSAEDLEAIAWWMRNAKKKGEEQ